MPRDPLIGLVGKPSSGKSTTLNSLTDASSKVGNFPFTTIDPQRAIGYLQVSCACGRFNVTDRCRPNYGSCVDGMRSVPIELLDVAGLVPGAHLGKGLGNKFLDDLRHADALIHVVDVSGTTDAEGKSTRGYDPSKDIIWLQTEIEKWIEGNLLKNWGGIKRRHVATKSTAVDTLQNQFSGYGSNHAVVARTLDTLALPTPLDQWDEATVTRVVQQFVRTRFPTVLALNKIDHADADANIARIAKAHPPESLVLTSAISEVFLRKLAKQRYVRYTEGGEFVDTREDLIEAGEPDGGGLLEMDEKLKSRIENLKDLVLYRFGSTGVVQVLSRAADLLGLVPVFPVKNSHALKAGGSVGASAGGGGGGGGSAEPPPPVPPPPSGTAAAGGAASAAAAAGGSASAREPIFRDCVLVKRGSTVRDVARKVIGDAPLAYVEGPGGVRVSEEDVVAVGKYDVLSFRIGR